MALYKPPPRWTEGEMDRLRQLRGDGLSASSIAREMGRSKNSVLGKLDRINRGLDAPTPPPRPAIPDRDPCPRCQTRGDLGCAHRAAGHTPRRLSSRA